MPKWSTFEQWADNRTAQVIEDDYIRAVERGTFEQLNPADVPDDEPTSVYRLGSIVHNFAPQLSPGRERVDRNLAFRWLDYARACKFHGIKPEPFKDAPYPTPVR